MLRIRASSFLSRRPRVFMQRRQIHDNGWSSEINVTTLQRQLDIVSARLEKLENHHDTSSERRNIAVAASVGLAFGFGFGFGIAHHYHPGPSKR